MRKIALTAALSINQWWFGVLQDEASRVFPEPQLEEEKIPVGCYL